MCLMVRSLVDCTAGLAGVKDKGCLLFYWTTYQMYHLVHSLVDCTVGLAGIEDTGLWVAS